MTFVGRVDGNPAIVFILMVLFVKGREHVVTASNSSYCTEHFLVQNSSRMDQRRRGINKALSSHK